jgi:beta-lactamase regulating signal transducer with metallopeptidase domain
MAFNRELQQNPFVALGILVLLSALVFWRIQKWRESTEVLANQTDQVRTGSVLPASRPDQSSSSLGFRIRQWIVLIWAILGIAGTLAAILWKVLRQGSS